MDEDDFISKTRRKRQMHELQEIGAALVELSAEQLSRLDLPEALLEAVLDAKPITKHEARRRQMQYIGRIMRGLDAGPIAERLNALRAPSKRETALLHTVERWRQELIADPENVARFVKEYPEGDPNRLRALITASQEERRQSKPPRQFRELFHVLNAILHDHAKRHP